MNNNYWLDVFSWSSWQDFQNSGSCVSGFNEPKWNTVKKVKIGDYLLCYMTGISRFVGILEVQGLAFKDTTKVFRDAEYPCRLRVSKVLELEPEYAVPVLALKNDLSIFKNLKNPNAWTGFFRNSLNKFALEDGKAIETALRAAKVNPVLIPFDPKKLKTDNSIIPIQGPSGIVTVPSSDDETANSILSCTDTKPTEHIEMQWLLLKLGSDLGLDVWVARNDKGKSFDGNKFSTLAHLKLELPSQFDEATNKTIELIDVLWLKGNSIVAAFEIESTTSIYSGLLRMSDLISMQPNLKIPLYIVAPEERRGKVITEVNRPTFRMLNTPLTDICRMITFQSLRDRIQAASSFVKHLKPDFLTDISENCELNDV